MTMKREIEFLEELRKALALHGRDYDSISADRINYKRKGGSKKKHKTRKK